MYTKASASLLRICVYARKIHQMIIIQSSNNPIVDVLHPAQKLQVWNTYIPGHTGKCTVADPEGLHWVCSNPPPCPPPPPPCFLIAYEN